MKEIRVKDIVAYMESFAPSLLKEDYDNVGLLVGNFEEKVTKVLVGLEVTHELIEEAIAEKCNLILVHHPLIFKPIYRMIEGEPLGDKLIKLVRHHISLYVAHTNLDKTSGGLNDFLAKKLQLSQIETATFIRTGQVKKQNLENFIDHAKEVLGLEYVAYVGNLKQTVEKVGLCTGSGMSLLKEAIEAKVHVFLTGDIKYHEALDALEQGICLIDAGHFGTEVIVKELFEEKLKEGFGNQLEVYSFQGEKNPIQVYKA